MSLKKMFIAGIFCASCGLGLWSQGVSHALTISTTPSLGGKGCKYCFKGSCGTGNLGKSDCTESSDGTCKESGAGCYITFQNTNTFIY
jgi:hypothetical protein